jgi:flavin-dependent dehydrogenase
MASGRTLRADALRYDVAVIGGGPAGATIATRLAQMGHRVCLVERSQFPRRRLGESLTPGVLPLLETTGARGLVESAGFPSARHVDVDWGAGASRREMPAGAGGLLVDRGRFDALLLDHARAAGVDVLQPALARVPERRDGAWRIPVDAEDGRVELTARFVAFAGGRSPRPRALRTGRPTLALHAWWTGGRLPDAPRIVAGYEGWSWGVPIPDGTYDTLVFVDQAAAADGPREPVAQRFHRLVRASGLLDGCEAPRLTGPVRAAIATPWLEADCVAPDSIRVGDAALALDPLSSSGVQKALQSAVSGAIVVNTLLRRPEDAELAMTFHRDALRRAYERHAAWTTGHYAAAAAHRDGRFWRDRAAAPVPVAAAPYARRGAWASAASVRVSGRCAFVDTPCLDADFVTRRTAVAHPSLDEPLAFLAGQELAPLLRAIPPGTGALGVAQAWSERLPSRTAFALVEWLVERELLDVGADDSAPAAGGVRP